MIRRKRIVAGIAALSLAGGAGYALRAAASGIPATKALTYAGVLEDATGPITGSHNILVILYDAATAGNNLCQSTTAAINVVDGHFSVPLPDACTAAIGSDANTWADVLVDGSDTGRTAIGAVPYAVEANRASAAAGGLAQQVVPSGAVMFFNQAACPAGWTDATAAQGRYLVGMPPTGTLAGTVGTALSNEENRAVGQHNHSATDQGHSHGVGAGQYYTYFNGSTCTGSTAPGSLCFDTSAGTGMGTANVTVANAGSVAGTNAPYVQYRVCQKQ